MRIYIHKYTHVMDVYVGVVKLGQKCVNEKKRKTKNYASRSINRSLHMYRHTYGH